MRIDSIEAFLSTLVSSNVTDNSSLSSRLVEFVPRPIAHSFDLLRISQPREGIIAVAKGEFDTSWGNTRLNEQKSSLVCVNKPPMINCIKRRGQTFPTPYAEAGKKRTARYDLDDTRLESTSGGFFLRNWLAKRSLSWLDAFGVVSRERFTMVPLDRMTAPSEIIRACFIETLSAAPNTDFANDKLGPRWKEGGLVVNVRPRGAYIGPTSVDFSLTEKPVHTWAVDDPYGSILSPVVIEGHATGDTKWGIDFEVPAARVSSTEKGVAHPTSRKDVMSLGIQLRRIADHYEPVSGLRHSRILKWDDTTMSSQWIPGYAFVRHAQRSLQLRGGETSSAGILMVTYQHPVEDVQAALELSKSKSSEEVGRRLNRVTVDSKGFSTVSNWGSRCVKGNPQSMRCSVKTKVRTDVESTMVYQKGPSGLMGRIRNLPVLLKCKELRKSLANLVDDFYGYLDVGSLSPHQTRQPWLDKRILKLSAGIPELEARSVGLGFTPTWGTWVPPLSNSYECEGSRGAALAHLAGYDCNAYLKHLAVNMAVIESDRMTVTWHHPNSVQPSETYDVGRNLAYLLDRADLVANGFLMRIVSANEPITGDIISAHAAIGATNSDTGWTQVPPQVPDVIPVNVSFSLDSYYSYLVKSLGTSLNMLEAFSSQPRVTNSEGSSIAVLSEREARSRFDEAFRKKDSASIGLNGSFVGRELRLTNGAVIGQNERDFLRWSVALEREVMRLASVWRSTTSSAGHLLPPKPIKRRKPWAQTLLGALGMLGSGYKVYDSTRR